ncbi:MAG: class I SAM-dependent methyltransferase [Burkholderiales bacterium]
MNEKLNSQELRNLYRQDYVDRFARQSTRRIRRLLPYMNLSATDIVADFACGNGFLVNVIHDKIAHYHGVDFSEEFTAAAKQRHAEAQTQHASFECADIKDFCARNPGHFDKAFALDFSEHLYDDDFVSIFSAISKSLKPEGALYIHTPNGEYFLEILKNRGWLKQLPGHVSVRRGEAYIRLLQAAGFSSIRLRYLPHYISILKCLHPLSFLPVIGKYFRARLFIDCSKS